MQNVCLTAYRLRVQNADMKLTRIGVSLTDKDLAALRKLRKKWEAEMGRIGNSAAIRRAIRVALQEGVKP